MGRRGKPDTVDRQRPRHSAARGDVRAALRRQGSAYFVLGLLALGGLSPLGNLLIPLASPALAGNDENDGAERRREQAERAREREEQRRQREQQRAAREAERQQREADRAQRAAERQRERQEREQERQARQENAGRNADGWASGRSQSTETSRYSPASERDTDRQSEQSSSARQVSSSESSSRSDEQNSTSSDRNTSNSRADGDKGGARTSSKPDDKDKGSSRTSSKPASQSNDKNKAASNNKNNSKDKEKDKDDDESSAKDDAAANEPPAEPPRTIVEWLKGWNKPAAKPSQDDDDKPAAAEVHDWTSSTNIKSVGTTSKAKPVTEKPAKATAVANTNKSVPASKSPKTVATGVSKRGAPDFELLQQGMFRQREVIASGLDAPASQRASLLGFKVVSSVAIPGQSEPVRKLAIPAGMSEPAALAALRLELPNVHFGPNHVYHIRPANDDKTAAVPAARTDESEAGNPNCNGPQCAAQQLIHWRPSLQQCASRVRVGIIDTSFDVTHPAFQTLKFKPDNFIGAAKPATNDWHGTAVLSVLAGASQSPTPGLVPEAYYLLASAFAADTAGNAAADAMSVLRALAWLDKEKVDIVNMSFSGPRNDEIEAAIAAMAAKGVIFVAAAGNRGPDGNASYPAAYEEVIAVTAVSKDRQSYRNANRGDYVDVSAPGVGIWTALPKSGQGYRTGTSFAAPFVTGLLAAMPKVRKGVQTKADVLSRISFDDLGAPGRDPIYGVGLPIAPERCNEIGGVASLPWTDEAKRMQVGAPLPPPAAVVASPVSIARPAAK
jgi:hypothetical protein